MYLIGERIIVKSSSLPNYFKYRKFGCGLHDFSTRIAYLAGIFADAAYSASSVHYDVAAELSSSFLVIVDMRSLLYYHGFLSLHLLPLSVLLNLFEVLTQNSH